MRRRPTVSVTIIALDEEPALGGLLERLGWADEIVVVDGGSRDATPAIARRHGCRLFQRAFDNFAAQRNFALEQARGDWVLSVDADERPTAALVAEIGRRVAGCRQAAFRVPIRSRIFGRQMRYGGTQDDCPVRLFRRDSAEWTGQVHERLQVRGAVGRLHAWLEHDSLPDLPSFLRKMDRYTTLEARSRAAAGRPPSWRQRWLLPPREALRRLLWKRGLFDGPRGWGFALLSGLSEWVLAGKHERLWKLEQRQDKERRHSPGLA